MLARIEYLFFALFVVLVFTADARSQGSVASDRVVVSYPSKSITSFPILETAQRRGFFRRENLDVSGDECGHGGGRPGAEIGASPVRTALISIPPRI